MSNINLKRRDKIFTWSVIIPLIFIAFFFGILIPSFLSSDMTAASVFLFILVAFVVIMTAGAPIIISLSGRKEYNAMIDKYGLDNLKVHLEKNLLKTYEYKNISKYTTYFTDKLIVVPDIAVVSYEEIAWMFKDRETSNDTSNYSFISLRLYNGKAVRICSHIKDEDLMEYFNFIFMHNSKILFGLDSGNPKKYNDRVYGYKKGILKITDPVDISEPLNKDEYDYSGVFPKKKGRFNSEEELEEYISRNYDYYSMQEAVLLYIEETGVDDKSATKEIVRIFNERNNKGRVLETPREYTKGYKSNRIRSAITFVIFVMLLVFFGATGVMIDEDSSDLVKFAFIGGFMISMAVFTVVASAFNSGSKTNMEDHK